MTDDPIDTLIDETDGCWLDYEHQQALAEIRRMLFGLGTVGDAWILFDRFFEENGTPK